MDIPDMSEREYDSTLESLVKNISDKDLDRLILNLQFMRAKRIRDFESKKKFGFCDKCERTYPAIIGECLICAKTLRQLPIYAQYFYLLDGPPKDNNPYYVEIK